MKKICVVLLLTTAFCASVKAQMNNPKKLFGVDSIKVLPAPLLPALKLPLLGQSNSLKDTHNSRENFVDLNQIASLDNMPVVKPTSTDRMPIAKLGDTQTTHFTMLIKPILNTAKTASTP